MTIGNSFGETGQLGYDELPVRLHAEGSPHGVKWSPSILEETSCDIDVTYWPFDTQLCGIDFVAQASSRDELRVIAWGKDEGATGMDGIYRDSFHVDSNWILENACVGKRKRLTPGIKFWLMFRRRTSYYVTNIILPVIFLSLNCPVVFILPLDCGEKMSFSITVLLAFAVYLSIVSSMLPVTSLNTAIITIYLTLMIALSTASILITAVTLRLNDCLESQKAGTKLKRFVTFIDVFMPGKVSHTKMMHSSTGVEEEQQHEPTAQAKDNVWEENLTLRRATAKLDVFFFFLLIVTIALGTLAIFLIIVVGGSQSFPTHPSYTQPVLCY